MLMVRWRRGRFSSSVEEPLKVRWRSTPLRGSDVSTPRPLQNSCSDCANFSGCVEQRSGSWAKAKDCRCAQKCQKRTNHYFKQSASCQRYCPSLNLGLQSYSETWTSYFKNCKRNKDENCDRSNLHIPPGHLRRRRSWGGRPSACCSSGASCARCGRGTPWRRSPEASPRSAWTPAFQTGRSACEELAFWIDIVFI